MKIVSISICGNIKWNEGVYNRTYDEYVECPRNNLVSNGKEAVNNFTSQQKWMVYCLNRFIKNVLNYQ